jgi:ArsR family transcriptional regulator
MPSKSNRHRLSDDALALIAARFKVLSEPTRLKLLLALETGEKNVTQLVQLTRATQANVSRQLQALADAGLVVRRREGVSVFYRVADAGIFDLCEHVCLGLQRQLVEQAKASRWFGVRSRAD